MASTRDLQELLRVLTTGNVTMMTAMGYVKSLQSVGLRSIRDIAEASSEVVSAAIRDDKAARSVQSACKKYRENLLPDGKNKRTSHDAFDLPAGKRLKAGEALPEPPGGVYSPAEAEQSLALPIITEEECLTSRRFYTNRAPILLAFTLELLRATMPEQPLSSRLSLAQAVVSINAKSKAVDLGLETSTKGGNGAWEVGQPKVKIMGREVIVLKRGGYPLCDSATAEINMPGGILGQQLSEAQEGESRTLYAGGEGDNENGLDGSSSISTGRPTRATPSAWSTSQRIDSRGSSFIAQAISFTGGQQAKAVVKSLLDSQSSLKTASHNFWGYRVQRSGHIGTDGISEGSNDDGESGGGDFIVRLLREADSVDRLVVVSRWFGGVMLGPDRWRLIRNCVNGALAEGLRQGSRVDCSEKVAFWALDPGPHNPIAGRDAHAAQHKFGLQHLGVSIHNPDIARSYLLRSFASPAEHTDSQGGVTAPPQGSKRQQSTMSATKKELEHNLAQVLGSLRLLFDSWATCLTPSELDQKAWAWYVAVRPSVEVGPQGWGAKGWLDLDSILRLRRLAE